LKKLALIVVALIAAAVPGTALATDKPGKPIRVTICHAKPADTAKRGWVEITVAVTATGFRQSGHADQHDADIIPAFTHKGFVYPGKNLTTDFGGVTGQEILDNECVKPTPVDPEDPTDPTDPTDPVDPVDPVVPQENRTGYCAPVEVLRADGTYGQFLDLPVDSHLVEPWASMGLVPASVGPNGELFCASPVTATPVVTPKPPVTQPKPTKPVAKPKPRPVAQPKPDKPPVKKSTPKRKPKPRALPYTP
jgi:hypothetical protein